MDSNFKLTKGVFMKKTFAITFLALTMVGCGKYIDTENLPNNDDHPVYAQPVPNPIPVTVNVTIGGDTINNSNSNSNNANGGNATNNNTSEGGSSSATGGSSSASGGAGGYSSNNISSGNSSSSASGTGGAGGSGGTSTSSAGNSTSTANNSSSSNSSSTNNSTNSGSASNQANNSTNNSSDNSADSGSTVSGSGNSTNSNTNNNTNSAEVNFDQDYSFNIELGGNEDYFKKAKKDRAKEPKQCVDPQAGRNLLCHVYDFNGRSQLATDLATAPHLGSFYMDKFDVTARSWDLGFPKFPSSLAYLRENYAVRCFTKLKVTSSGSHLFSITSDDGMRVLLNNSPVLSDDGLHAPRSASASSMLSVGTYNMEIQWFQGPRTEIAAELKWKTPDNQTLRYIESSDMQKAKKLCEK